MSGRGWSEANKNSDNSKVQVSRTATNLDRRIQTEASFLRLAILLGMTGLCCDDGYTLPPFRTCPLSQCNYTTVACMLELIMTTTLTPQHVSQLTGALCHPSDSLCR